MKIRNQWNSVNGDGFPIFSKDWFIVVLWVVVVILIFIGFVWIVGDKANKILMAFFGAGFLFLIGFNWGLHRAKMTRLKDEKDKIKKSE